MSSTPTPAPHPTCCLCKLPCGDRSPPWSVLLMFAVVAHAEYVKEAVQEDQAGNYQKAFDLYKIALEYFSTHLKYEKNPRSKAAISEKVRRCVYHLAFNVTERRRPHVDAVT